MPDIVGVVMHLELVRAHCVLNGAELITLGARGLQTSNAAAYQAMLHTYLYSLLVHATQYNLHALHAQARGV